MALHVFDHIIGDIIIRKIVVSDHDALPIWKLLYHNSLKFILYIGAAKGCDGVQPVLDTVPGGFELGNLSVNHVKLRLQQFCGTFDISVLVIFTYLVSRETESQKFTDKCKTAHVIYGVHSVIVLVISHRVQYPNLLIISDRIHADIKQLRQFPNLESILFLHNIISNSRSQITIKLLAASGSV